ncbi:DUF6538 domain-containing protein [Vibrio navarrensis]|uniref:DUF6538 domain-containing protein n=1 Tax=Vibrio navarrensis TaxID=29495 RepID=UPI001D05A7ED|nr:DUF6538 domain-containing protein [Vibrio navarrensis]
MRYLSISKSGIWQFRYQIPSEHRHLFDGLREVKRSLKTSCKDKATLLALELEIQVRRTIISPTTTTAPKQVRPIHNEKKHPPAKQKKLKVLCPEKMLERFLRISEHSDQSFPPCVSIVVA